jgi:hypothetical protein
MSSANSVVRSGRPRQQLVVRRTWQDDLVERPTVGVNQRTAPPRQKVTHRQSSAGRGEQ